MNLTHVYVPLTKADKQADGTMLVSGPITSSALDRDLQVCDPDWLDAAVPKWFGEGGNIREMHTAIAAGKALKCWKDDGGKHWVEALVVDPSSVAKVEHGVLTGFSIGIKGARVIKSESAPNGAIVDGAIIETSLVDRPANPECLLELAKSDEAGVVAPVQEQALLEGTEAVAEAVTPEAAPVVVDLTADEAVVAVEAAPEAAPVLQAASDVRARASEVLMALSSIGLKADLATLAKADGDAEGDETSDITGAQEAIAIIARLIQSEAQGLADGELSERYDIELLLEAVAALRWFIANEESEQVDDAVDAALASLNLADQATPTSAAPDEQPVAAAKTQEPDAPAPAATPETSEPTGELTVEKVQALIKESIEEALTEVTKSHEAETNALRDELAKVKAQPIPGGPVRVPTMQHKSQAIDHDRQLLLKKAEQYDQAAESTTDRSLAEGYRQLAQAEREKALR